MDQTSLNGTLIDGVSWSFWASWSKGHVSCCMIQRVELLSTDIPLPKSPRSKDTIIQFYGVLLQWFEPLIQTDLRGSEVLWHYCGWIGWQELKLTTFILLTVHQSRTFYAWSNKERYVEVHWDDCGIPSHAASVYLMGDWFMVQYCSNIEHAWLYEGAPCFPLRY